MKPEGFLRIKLIQADLPEDLKPPSNDRYETTVAINIKERVDSPGETTDNKTKPI